MASRVTFLSTLKPEDSWKFAAGVWIGLSLLENTPASQRAWPTKIGEYLVSGIPIITTDLPCLRERLISTRVGATVDRDMTELTTEQAEEILNSWAESLTNLEKFALRRRLKLKHGEVSQVTTSSPWQSRN